MPPRDRTTDPPATARPASVAPTRPAAGRRQHLGAMAGTLGMALCLLIGLLGVPVAGQPAPPPDEPVDGRVTEEDRRVAEVIISDDPRVEPDLGAVGLASPEYRVAVTAYQETERILFDAVRTIDESIITLRQLNDADRRLADELIATKRRRLKTELRLETVRADLQDLAVSQYVSGGVGGPLEGILDLEQANELGQRRVFVDAVQGDRRAEQRFLVRYLFEQAAAEQSAQEETDIVRQRIAETEERRDTAIGVRDRATVELIERRQDVADARLLADVVGLDFPFVNFNAYYRAARMIREERPDCGLRWSALAAIARTESWHGTFGGAEVDADGNLTVPIIGIALDGTNGTAVIGDSDGGELDGDPVFDRAVGPMQFIPTTWRVVARDGNGDGIADPQNLYDATLTAAAYLCRQGPGLETDDGMRRAFRSYNNDGGYVALVLARTHAYDAYEVPPLRPGEPSPSPAIIHAPPPDAPAPAGESGPDPSEDDPGDESTTGGSSPP